MRLALHAHRTGRSQFWFYVLIFLPMVGSLAYVLFELLPELANTRRARQVAQDVRTIVDPDRNWRDLNQKASQSETVEAKCEYAEECERKGMWTEAVDMYRKAAQGIYADDPEILRGLARAELGSGDALGAEATLNQLRTAHPEYQNQDAHLTFARALELQGRNSEASDEYHALIGYFAGLEARTRYALILQKSGHPVAARKLFDEVISVGEKSGLVVSAEDRDWVRVARRNV